MERTRKLTAIGILDIVSGALVFVIVVAILAAETMSGEFEVANLLVGVLFIASAILALIGGVCALRRNNRRLVIAGSLSASISVPFLGLLVGVLALTSFGISKTARKVLFTIFIPVWIIITPLILFGLPLAIWNY